MKGPEGSPRLKAAPHLGRSGWRKPLLLALAGLVVLGTAAGVFIYYRYGLPTTRTRQVLTWLRSSQSRPEWSIRHGERCGTAPFVFPTDGFIGFLWDDSFRMGHRHSGLDIFGGSDINVTPVVAAYPGYLSRLQDWKSTVIIRIPSDPLQLDRQIWTYYTHLAGPDGTSFVAPEFPPGTQEVYVEAGTLLGYQGNYSGTPGSPTGVHLHFSVVRDDGQGRFLNELEIENTLDPSPYLGLPVNAQDNPGEPPVCSEP